MLRAEYGLSLLNTLPHEKALLSGFVQPRVAPQHWHIVSCLKHWGDFLLPVQRPRRFQPLPRELGHSGDDDRGGDQDHPAGSEGELRGSPTPDRCHYFVTAMVQIWPQYARSQGRL